MINTKWCVDVQAGSSGMRKRSQDVSPVYANLAGATCKVSGCYKRQGLMPNQFVVSTKLANCAALQIDQQMVRAGNLDGLRALAHHASCVMRDLRFGRNDA
jgi:hypothetical protein